MTRRQILSLSERESLLGPVGAKLQNATFVLAGALINNKP